MVYNRGVASSSLTIGNVDTVDDLDDFDEKAEEGDIPLTSSNSIFIDNPPSLKQKVATHSSPHINCFYSIFLALLLWIVDPFLPVGDKLF